MDYESHKKKLDELYDIALKQKDVVMCLTVLNELCRIGKKDIENRKMPYFVAVS